MLGTGVIFKQITKELDL